MEYINIHFDPHDIRDVLANGDVVGQTEIELTLPPNYLRDNSVRQRIHAAQLVRGGCRHPARQPAAHSVRQDLIGRADA
jgi:hypothetical protein